MSPLTRIRPYTARLIDEIQLITGAVELGDYDASLRAVGRCAVHLESLRAEITRVMLASNKPASRRVWIVKPS